VRLEGNAGRRTASESSSQGISTAKLRWSNWVAWRHGSRRGKERRERRAWGF
jgi:hypothetical protein